ncbi:MAG: succinylglutamate desuccinylase/aspartoacylase family protein [Candidatus Hodarchaeales archaeon]
MSKVLKVQNLEAQKGQKVQGMLYIHEQPAYKHEVPFTLVNGVGDGPTILINGGEHGSEYGGPAGAMKLIDMIDPKDINGQVIIVPIVNTLAFEYRWMHGNPIDYRDMGGLYRYDEVPKGGSGPPKHSIQLALTFKKECIQQADYRLNLHGGDIEEDLIKSTMYGRSGVDVAREDLNLALCRSFGWEWIRESIRRPRPGVPARTPSGPVTVGTEAGGSGRCTMGMADEVLRGCLNVMKQLKMMEGEPEIPSKAYTYHPYHLHSSTGGMFISRVIAGDLVSEGDALGEIRHLNGKVVEEIIAPTDGVIHMVTSPAIWEGDVTYEIGKDVTEIE